LQVTVRSLLVLIGLAFSTALVCINGAGAKPPFEVGPAPTKTPPPGAGVHGVPGTITVTHYSADGLSVLGVERFAATASDSSASVAARFGKSAPDAVKTGTVTEWDDAGRPNAPVAQVESAAGTRSTSSVKGVRRLSDCCSSSGCDAIDVTRGIESDVFGTWLGDFHHRVYWCWSYPRVTGVNVSCWSVVDGSYVEDRGCDGWGNYYSWRGSGHGGHVSFRSGNWGNCIWWIGCVGSIYPWVEIWVNGNGAWAQDQGG
jgi:hypothetical protein